MVGEKITTIEWINGKLSEVRVEVEAIRPADDPGELYLTPETVRQLEQLQELADAGDVEELAKHGTVYVRQSA